MPRQYITTAIDYPNAAPHMGQVMEKVLTDVCARWMRLRGDEVRFLTGTDEHGVKIERTAKKEGASPQELVDRNVPLFEDLYNRLGISYDDFIRTTDRVRHWPTVKALWKKLAHAGVLEKRTYTGLYCSGCERFMTKRDLLDGKCPNHQRAPEEVTEENWFFLLSREGEWLKQLLQKEYRIVPDFRSQETFSLIEQGLEDVSFSRPASSLSWGIPVPDDPGQTMYVWCDALTNYISALDYFGLSDGPFDSASLHSGSFDSSVVYHERRAGISRLGVEWWDDAEVTHVIGKDITRFHALIWPAMLRHANVPIPDRLLVHGFINIAGQKMSKSLGNVVEPLAILERFSGNPDPLRFSLSEIPVGRDGDFSWDRIEDHYNSILRNGLGNLLHRVLTLLAKEGGELVLVPSPDITEKVASAWDEYQKSMDTFTLERGSHVAVNLMGYGNGMVDAREPWRMKGKEKVDFLSTLAELLRHISLQLLPFLPDTAKRMSEQLGVPYANRMLRKDFTITEEMRTFGGVKDWKSVGQPAILFPPLEVK